MICPPRRRWAISVAGLLGAFLASQSLAIDIHKLGEAGLQAVAPSSEGPVGLGGMLGGLSDSCSTVFTDLMKNTDFASCINLIGLVPLATINPKDSILPSFLNYEKGLSTAPTCDENTLSTIRAALKAKCDGKDEKQSAFVLLKSISENYPDIRKLLLVGPRSETDTAGDNGLAHYCLSTMLFRSEAAAGKPFTRDHLQLIFSGSIDDLVKFLLKDEKVSCQYCGSAVFQIGFGLALKNGYKPKDIVLIKEIIKNKCRSNAIDQPVQKEQLVIKKGGANAGPYTRHGKGALTLFLVLVATIV